MSMYIKIAISTICVSTLLIAGRAAAEQDAQSGQTTSQAKIESVKQLLTAKPFTGPLEQSTETFKASISLMAEFCAGQLDNANSAWNRSHPKWQIVTERIEADMRGELLTKLQGRSALLNDELAHTVSTRLSANDTNDILRFFRSAVGQRYLKFQERMTNTMTAASLLLLKKRQEQGKLENLANASDIQTQQRIYLFEEAIAFEMIGSMIENAKVNHKDYSGMTAMVTELFLVAQLQGDTFDQLYSEYSNDLVFYQRFRKSPEGERFFKEYFSALLDLLSRFEPLVIQISEEFMNKNAPTWRKIFTQ